MFHITDGKGFRMKFANGWTVSVQWGTGNYGDNRDMRYGAHANVEAGAKGSTTAEIAAWDANGVWHNFGEYDNDVVQGYVSADSAATFIQMVSNFKESK